MGSPLIQPKKAIHFVPRGPASWERRAAPGVICGTAGVGLQATSDPKRTTCERCLRALERETLRVRMPDRRDG